MQNTVFNWCFKPLKWREIITSPTNQLLVEATWLCKNVNNNPHSLISGKTKQHLTLGYLHKSTQLNFPEIKLSRFEKRKPCYTPKLWSLLKNSAVDCCQNCCHESILTCSEILTCILPTITSDEQHFIFWIWILLGFGILQSNNQRCNKSPPFFSPSAGIVTIRKSSVPVGTSDTDLRVLNSSQVRHMDILTIVSLHTFRNIHMFIIEIWTDVQTC